MRSDDVEHCVELIAAQYLTDPDTAAKEIARLLETEKITEDQIRGSLVYIIRVYTHRYGVVYKIGKTRHNLQGRISAHNRTYNAFGNIHVVVLWTCAVGG